MKFKLDENFGVSIQRILLEAGHDVKTAREEKLQGAQDIKVFTAAQKEERILISMDRGFGNVLSYGHEDTAGVVIINPPGRVSLQLLQLLTRTLLEGLKKNDIRGRLWIVEPGRIREHGSKDIPDTKE